MEQTLFLRYGTDFWKIIGIKQCSTGIGIPLVQSLNMNIWKKISEWKRIWKK